MVPSTSNVGYGHDDGGMHVLTLKANHRNTRSLSHHYYVRVQHISNIARYAKILWKTLTTVIFDFRVGYPFRIHSWIVDSAAGLQVRLARCPRRNSDQISWMPMEMRWGAQKWSRDFNHQMKLLKKSEFKLLCCRYRGMYSIENLGTAQPVLVFDTRAPEIDAMSSHRCKVSVSWWTAWGRNISKRLKSCKSPRWVLPTNKQTVTKLHDSHKSSLNVKEKWLDDINNMERKTWPTIYNLLPTIVCKL